MKGGRRRGWQRMRWLDGITDSMALGISRRWWRTGKAGVLQSMGSQRVKHDLATTQQNLFIKTGQCISNGNFKNPIQVTSFILNWKDKHEYLSKWLKAPWNTLNKNILLISLFFELPNNGFQCLKKKRLNIFGLNYQKLRCKNES